MASGMVNFQAAKMASVPSALMAMARLDLWKRVKKSLTMIVLACALVSFLCATILWLGGRPSTVVNINDLDFRSPSVWKYVGELATMVLFLDLRAFQPAYRYSWWCAFIMYGTYLMVCLEVIYLFLFGMNIFGLPIPIWMQVRGVNSPLSFMLMTEKCCCPRPRPQNSNSEVTI